MAVDANVLIFERIREEWHRVNPIISIDMGYGSMGTILDANVTRCWLRLFCSSLVQGRLGFAITLAIGL